MQIKYDKQYNSIKKVVYTFLFISSPILTGKRLTIEKNTVHKIDYGRRQCRLEIRWKNEEETDGMMWFAF